MATFAVLGHRSPFRASPTAVILLCNATVAAAAAYGAAGFVAVFDKIGREGSAGLGHVIPAVDALAIPSLLALGITAVTAIVVSVSQWRARASTPPIAGPTTAVSGTAAFVLAVSMAASLVAVNQWLLINEDLLGVTLAMTHPARAAAAGGSAGLIRQSEIALPLMLLGLVISLTTLATAFVAWRGSRTRRPNHLLVWSTRLAVVATLAGCVWHASVIGGQWRTFRTETTALLAR